MIQEGATETKASMQKDKTKIKGNENGEPNLSYRKSCLPAE
jgi:hypothetical protein